MAQAYALRPGTAATHETALRAPLPKAHPSLESRRPVSAPATPPPPAVPGPPDPGWWRAHLQPRLWLSHVLAALAAWLCIGLGTPLPWLIGPLLLTAGLCMSGVGMRSTNSLRNVGQWAIGTALGLYFTPQVMGIVWTHVWAIVLGIAWALAIGWGFAALLARAQPAGDGSRATAFFAGAIGGASEMALMAERNGGRVDLVASAHSVRILLVVLIIPFGFQFAGISGLDATLPGATEVDATGLLALIALTAGGCWGLQRLGMPNPVMLGALAVAMLLTVGGVELSALPTWVTNLGQLLIGVSLGTRFSRQFLLAAPRWLLTAALGTVALVLACAGFAWGVAQLSGLHVAIVLLGTSPGGIAEMCITAKVLQMGVPVVTAFHVTRMAAVVLLAEPMFRWWQARAEQAV